MPRVVQLDAPGIATGWGVADGDVAGEVDERAGDATRAEHRKRGVGRHALADASEVEFKAVDVRGVGTGPGVEPHVRSAAPRACRGGIGCGRHLARAPRRAPELRQRPHRRVERAARQRVPAERCLERRAQVRTHRRDGACRRGQPAHLACGHPVAERFLHRAHARERRLRRVVRRRLVHRMDHQPARRTHDDALVLVRRLRCSGRWRRAAAACECHRHQRRGSDACAGVRRAAMHQGKTTSSRLQSSSNDVLCWMATLRAMMRSIAPSPARASSDTPSRNASSDQTVLSGCMSSWMPSL